MFLTVLKWHSFNCFVPWLFLEWRIIYTQTHNIYSVCCKTSLDGSLRRTQQNSARIETVLIVLGFIGRSWLNAVNENNVDFQGQFMSYFPSVISTTVRLVEYSKCKSRKKHDYITWTWWFSYNDRNLLSRSKGRRHGQGCVHALLLAPPFQLLLLQQINSINSSLHEDSA